VCTYSNTTGVGVEGKKKPFTAWGPQQRLRLVTTGRTQHCASWQEVKKERSAGSQWQETVV